MRFLVSLEAWRKILGESRAQLVECEDLAGSSFI